MQQDLDHRGGVPPSGSGPDSRRLRVLWVILGLYFIVMMAGLFYAPRAPRQLVAIGGVVNMAILFAIVIPIVRIYRERK